MTEPNWLSAEQFAAMLSLPRSTVYDAVRTGRLEHRRIGGSIRIHRDAGLVPAVPRVKRPRTPQLVMVRNQRRAPR